MSGSVSVTVHLCHLFSCLIFVRGCWCVGVTSSDWEEVRRGVPQGSVLGPMFLNIFINDLFSQIKTVQLNMYADDGQLSTVVT